LAQFILLLIYKIKYELLAFTDQRLKLIPDQSLEVYLQMKFLATKTQNST